MTEDVRDYLIDTVKVKRDDAAWLVRIYTVLPDHKDDLLPLSERNLAFYIKVLQQLEDC